MEPTQVIIRPVISEKSFALAEAGKYTFRVHDQAHKTEIRQAVEDSHRFSPRQIFHRGIAGVNCARRDVRRGAALRGESSALADGQMSCGTHLAGKNAPLAHASGSGQSDLPAKKRVVAHLAGVPNLHEIVDLYATADVRFADRRAVNRAARLDFDVIFDDGGSSLAHFVPPAVSLARVTKAVAPDHHAILQNYAAPDAAVLADSGMRVRKEIVADFCALVDSHKAVKHGSSPNFDVFIHKAIWSDVRSPPDSG